jgi:hypothetical protein
VRLVVGDEHAGGHAGNLKATIVPHAGILGNGDDARSP